MGNEIQNILTNLANREDLTSDDAEYAFQIIMNGGATPAQIAAFLMGLRIKGETVTEITAGAKILRAKSVHIKAPKGAIDTCGTGGDMKRTLNISTAVAIVAAAAGAIVAKHGNRSISSASGSSDVLAALGVNIMSDINDTEQALRDIGICFMMAAKYHSSMRHIAPVRVELGLRTIFNLLGPLANPACVKRQLLGVYDKKWVRPLAEVLRGLGSERAIIVCGGDGMDEITLTRETYISELRDGKIIDYIITPEEFGFTCCTEEDLRGEDAEYNAIAMQKLFAGADGAYRDIVVINSAVALMVSNIAGDIHEGIALAVRAIDERKALHKLAELVRVS